MECYVFDTLNDAQALLDYINQVGQVPIIGRNAATGELEPDKSKTETWDTIEQRITDNKYYFSRVPVSISSQYPQSVIDNMYNNYNFTVEEYDLTWQPVSEVM